MHMIESQFAVQGNSFAIERGEEQSSEALAAVEMPAGVIAKY